MEASLPLQTAPLCPPRRESIPFGRLTAWAKTRLEKFFAVVFVQKKKKKKLGFGNEMEKPTHQRLEECLFNLFRAYRAGHTAGWGRGEESRANDEEKSRGGY